MKRWPVRRSWLLRGAGVLLLVAVLASLGGWSMYRHGTLIEIYHAPPHYDRRADTFTANVTGALTGRWTELAYRLNGGPWREVGRQHRRTPRPNFTIELPAEDLREGPNTLELRATAFARPAEIRSLTFTYDAAPVALPVTLDWGEVGALDVQDGRWETFRADDGGWRVRPVPGFEAYDRVLAVVGAFPGGRRVRTDVIFRSGPEKAAYGFGVFPMWAGQPDEPGGSPRRGWRFSLAWYYSLFRGVATEFSDKIGDDPPAWIATYRGLDLVPDRRYHILVEAWPETAADGSHRRYRQRLKWWPEGAPEPATWMEVADDWGAPLPPGEYAVALITLRAQVDFGPVTIEPLTGPPDPGELGVTARSASTGVDP